ncbi:MAG: radical SAM family heme chaperone HemW [Bacteriovoracaceae bacterium]|nr:radical SAM family heme chaperone HemW [Bacteriovoracaceae bacterium]
MSKIKRSRRNMVTYPFHYKQVSEESFLQKEKAALYLHIPFCNQKCSFCNFKAYKILDESSIDNYLTTLKKHINLYSQKRYYPEFVFDCVYFGGGNPGLLRQDQVLGILDTVRENFEITDNPEISMEFDPINVNEEKLVSYKEAGFNRLSMGVQSFDDEILKSVGRIHSAQDAIDSHELMKKAGFKNVNLDLVYPFPDLTVDKWSETIDTLVSLDPAAVSTYGLELWPGTPFYKQAQKGDFSVCSGDDEARMYDVANQKITSSGYDQLTVYGYMKKEYKAKYHCRFMEEYYWNNKPMVGLGVGAMSYIHGDFFVNTGNAKDYMNMVNRDELPLGLGKHLSMDERMRRFMIRGLKKTKISISDFKQRYGHDPCEYFEKEIDSCVSQKFMYIEDDFIRLTLLGCNYNTNVYREFFIQGDTDTVEGEMNVNFGLSFDVDDGIEGKFRG